MVMVAKSVPKAAKHAKMAIIVTPVFLEVSLMQIS